LRELAAEAAAQKTFLGGALHVQERLRIGWGTARVAVGIALGNHMYDWFVLSFG
jgi:hypothetical protein